MNAQSLPYVDEHATLIEAAPERVWEALGQVLTRAFDARKRAIGRALGTRPLDPSGDPLTTGASLLGFRVAAAEPAAVLALRGEHRYSRYALTFRIDAPEAGDRSRLRAETRAAFPGASGRIYRALVIGTRGHVLVVRGDEGARRALG